MMSLKTKPNQTQPFPSALSESRKQTIFLWKVILDLLSGNVIWKSVSAVHVFFCVVWAASLVYHLMLHAQWNVLQEEEGR